MADGERGDLVHRDARLDHSVPHTDVHDHVRRFLELAQDVLIIALAVVLFGLMLRVLQLLVTQILLPQIAFRIVVSEVIFMLVLVEILRLLIVYLRDHRVAIDVMVEISIVSVLREAVLRGIVELTPAQIVAIAAFLVVLGLLLRYGTLRPSGRGAHRPPDRMATDAESSSVAPDPEGGGIQGS